MTALVASLYLNALVVGPTAAQAAALTVLDSKLERVGMDQFATKPASFIIWSIPVFTSANNNTEYSPVVRVPWPLNIYGVDFGAETSAGTTGTMDLETSDDNITFASILAAPVDVKTGVGTCARGTPEDDAYQVDYNTYLRVASTSGSAAAQTGAIAHIYAQRQ